MDNPFELINQKLDRIEKLISNLNLVIEAPVGKKILNIDELSEFIGLSKSYIYKLTSGRQIPYYKRGKHIHFMEDEIIEWIKQGRIKTRDEIEREASVYIVRKNRV